MRKKAQAPSLVRRQSSTPSAFWALCNRSFSDPTVLWRRRRQTLFEVGLGVRARRAQAPDLSDDERIDDDDAAAPEDEQHKDGEDALVQSKAMMPDGG